MYQNSSQSKNLTGLLNMGEETLKSNKKMKLINFHFNQLNLQIKFLIFKNF